MFRDKKRSFLFRALFPDPVLDRLRTRKQPCTVSRRSTTTHGRPGRPPGSLNKATTSRPVPARSNLGGKGAKGGKAGGKAGGKSGKLKKQSSLISNVPFERQRFGNLRGKLYFKIS